MKLYKIEVKQTLDDNNESTSTIYKVEFDTCEQLLLNYKPDIETKEDARLEIMKLRQIIATQEVIITEQLNVIANLKEARLHKHES